MVCSGLLSILFGGTKYLGIHSMWFLLILQILSGIFQSTGWPGVVTVVANWFGKGKKGLIMGIWNSHTSVGNILGSVIAGFFVNHNWGLSFIVPGALMCLLGIIIFLFLIPSPEDVDMEPNTLVVSDSLSSALIRQSSSSSKLYDSSSDTEGPSPPKDEAIGFCGALRIPGVIEYSLCLFFAKLVSYTFLYWLPNYISTISHIDAKQSATMSTYFDFGGIIGGIFAGVVSDKSGMSATTCALMLTSALPTLYFYQDIVSTTCPLSQINGTPIHDACFAVNFALLMLTGLLVNGPYALITTAVSAELGTHKSLKGSGRALATVTAIIDGTGSIGAALGPFMAGYLTGNGSWSSVFNMLIFSNIMALILLVRLVKGELRRWQRRRYSL